MGDGEAKAFGIIFIMMCFGMMGLALFTMFSLAAGNNEEADQRDWIAANIEENYTVSDVTLDFPDGYPDYENSKERFFTIEGFSDDLLDRVETKGYLDFEEQVVVVSNDADGVFLPVDGSDAARVLTATTESGA